MSIASAGLGIQGLRASTQQRDVVVIGAGPYGLSVAAHLAEKGLNVAIFGRPMQAWQENMPYGMFLRSHWWATSLSDPHKKYDLKHFFADSKYDICYPMPIQLFIDYGMWFQKQVVPSVDPTYVSSVEYSDGQFVLTLEDGRTVVSVAVVMAIGPGYFSYVPSEYAHLPAELLTHSHEHSDSSRFAGKRVAIIGGGQSAVESAALLNEAGASVDLIARRPLVWLDSHGAANRPLLQRLRAPDSAIATGWRFLALDKFPYLFQHFSEEKKARMVKNNHWPAASNWLADRITEKVNRHEGLIVTTALEDGGGVQLTLSDNATLRVDHIIAATGYQTDVSRLPFLSPAIRSGIKTHLGSPILNSRFESSVSGLYFTGLSSLQSFGPLYRFVAGASATAPRVASAVARQVAKMR